MTTQENSLPWCIYRYVRPMGIGRVDQDRGRYCAVRYSEAQLYPPETWDAKYLERFATLRESLEALACQTRKRVEQVLEEVEINFPSAVRQEQLTVSEGALI